jgi:Mlc titration factor MtfA (ptsG expression regulator)
MVFKSRRRKKITSRPFPAEWLALIERNVPLYRFLPEADRAELLRHTQIFLAEKRFEGCGGLEITDEVRVTIAAQACVLLLHRKTDYYPGLSTILVYPHGYVADKARHLVGGIIVEGQDVRLGESWHHGSVVLSWHDVRRGAANIRDGHNIVFHEFAHQLDTTWGKGDSVTRPASWPGPRHWGVTSNSSDAGPSGADPRSSTTMGPPTRRSSSRSRPSVSLKNPER